MAAVEKRMTLTGSEDLSVLAARVLALLPQRSEATVLALHGELGAGKTAFVQALARELGVAEHVVSPTFLVMRSYDIARHDFFHTLIHIDAYQTESPEELRILNFGDVLQKPENLICVEWAEKVAELLPEDTFHIRFSHGEDSNTREVVYG